VSASDLRSRFNGSPGANSAEALFAVDVNQRIIAWNAEAARVFGYTAASAIGDPCYRLVGGRDQTGRRFCRLECPVIRSARVGDAPPTVRLSARASDGTTVTVDVSTIVLAGEDGPGPVIHLCRAAGLAPELESEAGAPSQLTSRERQVLLALCRGCSTEAIASELGVSPTTIRNHVQHLLAKLAAHSRAEAVGLAYREGLIP
jgi:PAS domain S-box-containing protein